MNFKGNNILSKHHLLLMKNNIEVLEADSDYETSDDEKINEIQNNDLLFIDKEIQNNDFLFIEGEINNMKIKFYLDTYSNHSRLPIDFIKKCNLEEYINKDTIYIQVIFESNNIYYNSFLVSSGDMAILGTDMMKKLGIVIDFTNMKISFPIK